MASSRSDRFRTDIQALRALAVVAVVVNHVWPDVLPGGYVGVDVFFVISGFLITSHLVEHPPARLYDLAAFWGRRIRRLLPAALLVLGLTLIAVRTCTPQTTWEPTARSVRAAATYWLNWLLAHDAVDYLRGDDTATAVQHYWSLSVEEQFYLVWPVLLLIVGWLARRRFERVVPVVLAVILVGSLTASVWVTHANASAAYFVTHTRIWELAAGGLLAVLGLTLPKWASWIGWAGIAATCVLYSDTTAFPGYTALLPVTATIIVIAARDQNPLVSLRPVQWLGDISYSLYLWHWPVLLLAPQVAHTLIPRTDPDTIGLTENVAMVAAGVVAAWLTKLLVEDPVRRLRVRLRWLFPAAALGMAVVVGGSQLQLHEVDVRLAASWQDTLDVLEEIQSSDDPCLGAAALANAGQCEPTTVATLRNTPLQAANDPYFQPWVMERCANKVKDTTIDEIVCGLGDGDAPLHVALVGNSHAAQLLPGLAPMFTDVDMALTLYTVGGCQLGLAEVMKPGWDLGPACTAWSERTTAALLKAHPDVIVTSNSQGGEWNPGVDPVAVAKAELQTFADAGIPVVVVRDLPVPDTNIPECVDAHPDDPGQCSASLRDDFYYQAATELDSPLVATVDLTGYLCTADGSCPALVGNLIAYLDQSHVNATYMTTLSPYLRQALLGTGFFDAGFFDAGLGSGG